MLHRKLIAAVVVGSAMVAGTSAVRADESRAAGATPAPNGTLTTPGDGRDWGRQSARRDDDGRLFARPDGYGSTPDFPGIEVHDWVSANANAAAAKAIFRRAENELAGAFRRVQREFERSKDLQEAVAAEREAYADYLVARQKALQAVLDDPRYKQIMSMRDDMARKLAAARVTQDLSRDEVLALATLKLNYASDARAMETAAINADSGLKDSRSRMVSAGAKVATLRTNFDDSLHDNPEIGGARWHLEDARIALVTAQAYLNASAISGGAAIDYAYYTRGAGQLRGYDPYVGSGNGPSSPYWVRY